MNRQLLGVFFLGLVVWTSSAWSGEFRGTVKNRQGKVLEGIFVSARDTVRHMTTTVITNNKGAYVIEKLPPGTYEVEAKQIGYVSQKIIQYAGRASSREIHFVLDNMKEITDQLPSSTFMSLIPESEKKRFMAVACMGCHQFNRRIIEKDGKRHTKDQWAQSINKMLALFGPSTGFPIIPPVGDIEGTASWYAQHLSGKVKFDKKNIPAPIKGHETKIVYTEYNMPQEYDLPHDLMVDKQGKVVVTGMFTHTMYELDPASGEFKAYPIPQQAAGPRALEIDDTGTWWVLLGNPRKMGRFNPREGEWKMFDIKEYPHSIGRDKKGMIWFNGHFSKNPEVIAKMDPASGNIQWYEVPSANMTDAQGGPIPYELRVGPDGTIWGGELSGNRIFKLDPGTEKFKVYTMPTMHSGPRRFDIGPDGILWIPEYGGNNLTRFDPKTEKFKQFPYPTSSALPYVVRVNHQTGAVWIATAGSDEVATFDPKTERFVVYRLPTQVALIRHMDIDPKTGAVWVAYASVPAVHPKVVRIEMIN